LSRVGHSTHELPAGYLGEPNNDLVELKEAESLLCGLSNADDRALLFVDISEERNLILEYLRNQKL